MLVFAFRGGGHVAKDLFWAGPSRRGRKPLAASRWGVPRKLSKGAIDRACAALAKP